MGTSYNKSGLPVRPYNNKFPRILFILGFVFFGFKLSTFYNNISDMPVNSVDHINIGDGKPGEITRKLQEYFFKIVRGEISKYRHWLTPVYGKK